MSTLKLIIEKIIKTTTNYFSVNYTKDDDIDIFIKLFFALFLKENISVKNKFNFLKETLKNPFLKGKENDFINYFCKIQKTNNALNKFAFIYKYNKAQTVVNTDMTLNIIAENEKNIICIFHNNSKYLFNIYDLIKIINSSLSNNEVFFAEPLPTKNPYNNIPFDKSILYNIYFYIKYKTYYYPELFYYFFRCDFNLHIFKKENEYLLRDISIHNYVYKSTSKILLSIIKHMINRFNDFCKQQKLKNFIKIDKDFPKDKLIKIMQPYLLLYCLSEYSFLPFKQRETRAIFRYNLLRFNSYNKKFGRKKYKISFKYENNFKKIYSKIIEYDDDHIPFINYEKENEHFLKDHLNNYNINSRNNILHERGRAIFYANTVNIYNAYNTDDETEVNEEEETQQEETEQEETEQEYTYDSDISNIDIDTSD
jgi:hypothetical protein